ncbi:MAG: endolytic transglycosylase MltG [Desulfuromonadales bacterium]|nr:endolytic transglycosylase MltG [Desulfuromonadales bacterium]
MVLTRLRSFRRTIFLLVSLLLFIVGGMLTTAWLFVTHPVTPATAVVLQIKKGTAFNTVAHRLEASGLISNARMFSLLARLRDEIGSIQAGEYDFSQPATPKEILDRLVKGDVRRIQFTIPEGFTLRQIGERLAALNIAPLDAFLLLAVDERFLASHNIRGDSLEGYLFPETYTIRTGLPLTTLLESMLDQLDQQLTPELLDAASGHKLDRHQFLTLASIVQKEAGNDEEMPLIAAVFLNRLKKRMRLQADPTVIYGLGEEYQGNITLAHLRRPTPYNTYTISGLPPGPIASPGQAALLATAFPADVNYLYFVSRGDGTHIFSRTLKEHNQAVRRYQLRR